eukprot:TRINITY_DN4914_c0_g2_i1.p1 TRINITY_DN4914_c0_g2~~TRINITY_DN4914_c0_g2_i1.p1  ORF type:complete len:520 (-),score=138.91 TRINITY_DN4914_c0_g2_i1:201-1760(-)
MAFVDLLLVVLGFVFQWGAIVILLFLSGLFSGLNVGLLSLDLVSLEIVIKSGTAKDAKYAKRIYPLRKKGNLLLCTVLLGNVAVNALLSILLAQVAGGLMAFLASTVLIVLFGEIVPMAVCTRHPLLIGYYTVWFVWIVLVLVYILAKPLAMILDCILGEEIGTIYSRRELVKLLEIHTEVHKSDLTHSETSILSGALQFNLKEVSEIMTDLDSVYMLDNEARLDVDTITKILESGYSRIPVYEMDRTNIVGMMFVKDLMLLDPGDELELRDVLQAFGRPLPRVFSDVTMTELLKEFKAGRSHMAVVRRVNADGEGDPFYENIGVVTLEDVLEEILQDEIIDETDVYLNNKSKQALDTDRIDYVRNFYMFQQASGATKLSDDQMEECAQLLRQHDATFGPDRVSDVVLRRLIGVATIISSDDSSDDGEPGGEKMLHQQGKAASACIVVLRGRVEERDVADGSVVAVHEAGSLLAPDALSVPGYLALYDLVLVGSDAQVIEISSRAHKSAVQATILEREA